MSGDPRQPSRPELLAELEALLARAGDAQRRRRPPAELERAPRLAGSPASLTPWQRYAAELRDLCERVLEDADDETAAAFWIFLVEMAARHGRRSGEWPERPE